MALEHDDANTNAETTALTLYSDEESKQPIVWDKNVASINGTLAYVSRAIVAQHPDIHKLIVTNTVAITIAVTV